ncbi:MAG: hypothetical protein BMS9Abin29_1846 [Gemmatimonadota bacterium]|nr:MAG: hypothetical protein BMS9Abin29_1846 [Gemmatimonadota bacterium]
MRPPLTRRQIAAVFLTTLLASCGDGGPTTPPDSGLDGVFTIVGLGSSGGVFTADLWAAGDHVYTGSLFNDVNQVSVWDVSDPTQPVEVDALVIDAGRLNDVKVSTDGTLAVVTVSQSQDGRNGIVLLDLANPARPTVITRYTTNLERGVHNVWIEGEFIYLVQNGPPGDGRLRILDIADPAQPVEVASFSDPGGSLHDVYVRDGLAFLSFLNAGLIIIDVGNSIAGGSPQNPREVSRVLLGGQTHNAWYWPEGQYVFVGEEDFTKVGSRAAGVLHVVDVSDIRNPRETATFETELNRSPPHNFWLDESRGVLYAAWYDEGLVALNVNGELSGELENQNRVIDIVHPFGEGACFGTGTCIWAPQLDNGLIYVSDLNNGIAVLRMDF